MGVHDGVDRRPIEQRIAVVRQEEEAGLLPTEGDKTWSCDFCDFETSDPVKAHAHSVLQEVRREMVHRGPR